jgi:hypothetical protein
VGVLEEDDSSQGSTVMELSLATHASPVSASMGPAASNLTEVLCLLLFDVTAVAVADAAAAC